jgi:hypothetical protein
VNECRGNWVSLCHAREAAALNYKSGNFELLSKSGKILSGYKSATESVTIPMLHFVQKVEPEFDPDKLDNFLAELFNADFKIMTSAIKPFAYAMFASFLRFYDVFFKKYSEEHYVLKLFLGVAKKHKISELQVQKWGKEIGK